MELFGFEILRKKSEQEIPSIVSPTKDDGSIEVAAGGAYGTYVDMDGKAKSEGELVSKYRQMSIQPECDIAVQDIINEAISMDTNDSAIEIQLDKLKVSVSIKNKIRDEFNNMLGLLDFNNEGYDIFKKWYVDGRLYYHIMIDDKNPKNGIVDLRYIDPRKIRKIKEPIKEKDARTGAVLYVGVNEYYMYNAKGLSNAGSAEGVRLAPDSILYNHSGVLDSRNNLIYGHLHKAIKPLNQLRMLEDAVVIYRLARAPERRIFYIDVGNLPKVKAEQYLRDMMVKHKNKLTYDATTGEVRDDRKFMTMLEDFWLPRREGGRGTEITTLPGGQNLGEMDDVEYFKKKLYHALNVPISRLESDNAFQIGRGSEITRDELKFSKFIDRIRGRFATMFNDLLEIQLALKGITTRDEWKAMKVAVNYEWSRDNHFTELKESEILRNRLEILADVDQHVGKYFSLSWIRKNVLQMSEEEIDKIDTEIQDEEDTGDDGDTEDDGGGWEETKQSLPALEQKETVSTFENIENEILSEEEKTLIEKYDHVLDSVAKD
jgi:hypothetical protein